MKKKIFIPILLGCVMAASGINNKPTVKRLVEDKKMCHTVAEMTAILNNQSSVKRYDGVYEFNMKNSTSAQYANMLWNICFSFNMPTSAIQVMNNAGEYLGSNTYTSDRYVAERKFKRKESLQYRVTHNPNVATTQITIENGYSTSTSVGFGFGVYAEGSFYASVKFEESFGINFTNVETYNRSVTLDLSAQNKPKGEYEVYINYYLCNKFFFKFDNNGKLAKVGMYTNCPLPNVDYTVVKVGDID